MKNLEDIQKRFEEAEEKEHWEKVEDVVVFRGQRECCHGDELLETLDEKVYYDGICNVFER